jgi:hypothetical protein
MHTTPTLPDNAPLIAPRHVSDATMVTLHPELFATQPAIRDIAWHVLMAARGRRVNLPRLERLRMAMTERPRPANREWLAHV